MKKKEKVMKIFEDYGDYILFASYELRTIKGDASSELVKCKSSKTHFQSNLPEKSGHIQSLDWGLVNFAEHVRPSSPDMFGPL
jgi:hypothetical protein